MVGCAALFVGEKIVFIRHERPAATDDNGVWIASTRERHRSLLQDLPSLRSIGVMGGGTTGWQNVPADSPSFEQEVLRACELVLARDSRIGKVPAVRRRRGAPRMQTRGARQR